MTSSAAFKPGVGVILTINGTDEGLTLVIPDHWTIAALENHIKELEQWLA